MLKELVVMKSLNWELSPATSNCWLGIYMQLANALEERHITESKENKSAFEMKQFSSHTFMQAARLLDLCTLDVLSLRYPNSIIAAAAVYHTKGETIALKTSGRLNFFYKQKDLKNSGLIMIPHRIHVGRDFFMHILDGSVRLNLERDGPGRSQDFSANSLGRFA